MALRTTRKTWETAFLLSAAMSSSYQETFDRAQAIMRDLGLESEKTAQQQENAFAMMAAAVAESGLYELLGDVKDAFTDVIQVTEEFEYTISAVQAISDAGAEDIAKLEAKARELGETTVYTAQQSSEAMTFMAQAGWDTTEMLSGMSGVISLAAASGTDLAETSSIVADTLAGFGMAADETGRLADVLAQTASHTNTNVSLLGETFSNAAAIAGALGFEIEDVSVMLGLMANAGVKGSRAGTTLRNIFSGLAKDVTLTAEAFGDVTFSMFDEEGNSRKLIEVARELRGYFDQMTDKEKYLNASALAGMRGYNGLLAIVNATDEQFEELYADIQNADGAAKKMADTRLDNLKGDVTLLNSAFESLKITLGEHFMPAGREFAQWLTSVVTGTNELIEAHPGIVTGLTDIAGAAAGVAVSFAAVTSAIKIKSTLALLAKAFTPGGWVVVGIGAVVGLLAAMAAHAAEVRAEALAVYEDQIKTAEEVQAYIDTYTETSKVWKESLQSIEEEGNNTEYLADKLGRLMEVQDKTLTQKQEILSIVQLLNEAIPDLALAYNAEADSINLTADAIRERARAEVYAEEMAEKQEQLKERIRQENKLKSEFEEARDSYQTTKDMYEQVLEDFVKESFAGYGDYYKTVKEEDPELYRETVESGIRNDLYVKTAYEAMSQAQSAMINARAAWADNAQRINQLSEDTAEYAASRAGQDAADVQAEKEGREAAKRLEPGRDYSAEELQAMQGGTWVSSEDVSDQYNGADSEPEGAVIASDSGDTNVTVNVNVAGNVTEDAMPELQRAAREAAELAIAELEKRKNRSLRLRYE